MGTERQGPLVVECTRGPAVESRHLVDVAVVDAAGRLVQGWGETETIVYPRSAIKSVQVLPLIESGAAERHAVSDEEIALACSSHNGQPEHVAVVRGWLDRAQASARTTSNAARICPITRRAPTPACARVRAGGRSTTCAPASTPPSW